jgi:hypothetical protein
MENNNNYIIHDEQFEQDENAEQQQHQEYNQIVQFTNNEELAEWFQAEDTWTRWDDKIFKISLVHIIF